MKVFMGGPKAATLCLALLVLCTLIFTVHAHGHKHGHGHLHGHHHNSAGDASGQAAKRDNTTGASDSERIYAQALEAMKQANKARLQHPTFNKHKVSDKSEPSKPAPPLDYKNVNSTLEQRSVDSSNVTSAKAYSIPKEVRDAARMIAESTPQEPKGDHASVASEMRKKYSDRTNDTNTPEPLQAPYGKLREWALNDDQAVLEGRDSGYWMVDMAKRGSSPYAQSGYKVWRNVKDYGAVGDGSTDDTEAINKAISDGGRCGANCGSSTVRPATVYFPPGTYLVSSSIIQYYNTEFLGDPINVPTILAASSFVGLGVMSSDVYVSDDEEWYLNTNNFLRSIRNFKIDIRNTDPSAYVCGIHWQVAQATSLENIEFYMLRNTDVPGNTQQGIYMENGSGGFLSDLTFIGGNFGAYFGNQQFTTSGLLFVNCDTAVQVHWDWAWTMHDYVIEGCQTGLAIINGVATGNGNTGQGVGSVMLVDSLIANTPIGIVSSPVVEDSTSFLAQNVGFFNVPIAVQQKEPQSGDTKTLVKGGNEVLLKSWGFGKVSSTPSDGSESEETFVGGSDIPTMERNEVLLGDAYDGMAKRFFTRRRPKYYDVPESRIMDVRALGAKGDGRTDDGPVLNSILDGAANTSSIVYFPYGSYLVKETLRVPVGCRIIGQAWPSIVARGPYFQDAENPKPLLQVGKPGEKGIVEIQSMLLTHSGATAGAVMIEWNVRESSPGSAGMWDTHVRVGGAIGTEMLSRHCPKNSGAVKDKCIGASMLMHMTPGSTGYLENVWLWVADHDLDKVSQDQIDIYAGRGLLVESDHAWLWGTSVEHCALYQYQLSRAKNILLSMVQTESPYWQPVPSAPKPFKTPMFPDDPTFSDCKESEEKGCGLSWAVRILDSSSIYMLGGGLYSWFYDYSQDCLDTEDCQQRGFQIRQSKDIWLYNICTKAIKEMVSPLGNAPTLAANNVNGFLSTVLAWLQGSKQTIGIGDFEGFLVYEPDELSKMQTKLPSACKAALTEHVNCEDTVATFGRLEYRGSLFNDSLTDAVCESGCGESLDSWFENVASACSGYKMDDGSYPTLLGGRMYAGYNETCLKDKSTGAYCNDMIMGFSTVDSFEEMPEEEMCSYCYVERNAMMARTPYSTYDEFYQERLEYIFSRCGESGPTKIPDPLIPPPAVDNTCLSGQKYITSQGDTCDSIAEQHSFASASLQMANVMSIPDCGSIADAVELCLPLSCEKTHVVKENDTCLGLEIGGYDDGLRPGDIRRFNPWVNSQCSNLWSASDAVYGHIICLSPQNGVGQSTTPVNDKPQRPNGAIRDHWLPSAPPKDAVKAEGTTDRCAIWYEVPEDDDGATSCPLICVTGGSTVDLLMDANPSLGTDIAKCSDNIKPGTLYCALPAANWRWVYDEDDNLIRQ